MILLMVQKAGVHQLRLVKYPIFLQGLIIIPVGCLGCLNHQKYLDIFGQIITTNQPVGGRKWWLSKGISYKMP